MNIFMIFLFNFIGIMQDVFTT